MQNLDKIKYWARECGKEFPINEDIFYSQTEQLEIAGILNVYELEDLKGVVAWIIAPDFKGNVSVCEMLLYVKPEHRKNPKNFITLLRVLEREADRLSCELRISSAFDYRGNIMLELLIRRGYIIDTVRRKKNGSI